MIVTFSCQKNIFIYSDSSVIRPRLPYKVHNNIDKAKQFLRLRHIKNPKIIEYK